MKDDKFHPITQYGGVSKNNRVRYSNNIGSQQLLQESVKLFARKTKEKYNEYKAKQDAKFEKDLEMRRKFEGRLISAYMLARKQQISSPRDLEKFIRQQIPDLPKGKETDEFVVRTLRDFKNRIENLEKSQKGKPKEEQKALEDEFKDSIRESQASFKKIQAEQDKKFVDDQKKYREEINKKLEKLEKEAQEKEDAVKQMKKDFEELQKKKKEGASKEEQQNAQHKADESAKKAEKESKDETTFASDVAEELKKDEAKIEFDFSESFPSGIV